AALDALASSVDTTAFAAPAVVFNPTPFHRHDVVEIGGRLHPADVPPLGWTTIETGVNDPERLDHLVEVGDGWMANGHLRIEWDADGLLTSVHDLDHDRAVLAGGAVGNLFQLHEDRPRDY